MVNLLLFLFFFIILVEIIFRSLYFFKNKSSYTFIRKVPFKSLAVKPHPYLTFILKNSFPMSSNKPKVLVLLFPRVRFFTGDFAALKNLRLQKFRHRVFRFRGIS